MIDPNAIDIDELIGALIEGKIPPEQRADWLAFIGSDSRYSEILALAEATLKAEQAEPPPEPSPEELDTYKTHLNQMIQAQCRKETDQSSSLTLGLYYAGETLKSWRLEHAESRIARPLFSPYGGLLEHPDLMPFPQVMMAYFNDRIECRFPEISPVYVDFKMLRESQIFDTRTRRRLRLYLPDPLKKESDYRLLRMELLEQTENSYRMKLLLV